MVTEAWRRCQSRTRFSSVADKPERVERQRREARNEAVHGVVEARGFVGDQSRRVARWRSIARLRGDGEREAADRGDRLAELIVQLVRDQSAFLLDALVRQRSHFPALLEARFRLVRLDARHCTLSSTRLPPCG